MSSKIDIAIAGRAEASRKARAERDAAKAQKEAEEMAKIMPFPWMKVVFVIPAIIGVALMILAANGTFGSVNSLSFKSTMALGGAVSLLSIIGILKAPRYNKLFAYEMFKQKLSENGGDYEKALRAMPKGLFKNKSQELAKELFTLVMRDLDLEVDFPMAGEVNIGYLQGLEGDLDKSVFHHSTTEEGIGTDLILSSRDPFHLHVYQICSQYNASEAPSPFTPSIGEAMKSSGEDRTQGPLAQRTNPKVFELVTAFLTHFGFNMLARVLPSAGKTYVNGDPIEHGYLRPNNGNVSRLGEEFTQNFSKAEYVCYSSKPIDFSHQKQYPIKVFLQAAPAIGYSPNLSQDTSDLQKYAALANYLAIFRYGIELANKNPIPVVLHIAAVGLGVFGNELTNVQWAFKQAALLLQNQMKGKVTVQIEDYSPSQNRPMLNLARNLGLELNRPRIGDPAPVQQAQPPVLQLPPVQIALPPQTPSKATGQVQQPQVTAAPSPALQLMPRANPSPGSEVDAAPTVLTLAPKPAKPADPVAQPPLAQVLSLQPGPDVEKDMMILPESLQGLTRTLCCRAGKHTIKLSHGNKETVSLELSKPIYLFGEVDLEKLFKLDSEPSVFLLISKSDFSTIEKLVHDGAFGTEDEGYFGYGEWMIVCKFPADLKKISGWFTKELCYVPVSIQPMRDDTAIYLNDGFPVQKGETDSINAQKKRADLPFGIGEEEPVSVHHLETMVGRRKIPAISTGSFFADMYHPTDSEKNKVGILLQDLDKCGIKGFMCNHYHHLLVLYKSEKGELLTPKDVADLLKGPNGVKILAAFQKAGTETFLAKAWAESFIQCYGQ